MENQPKEEKQGLNNNIGTIVLGQECSSCACRPILALKIC